jgi:YbbR domain-containing protein
MRQILEKTGWRVLALATAVALWLALVARPEVTRAIVVPIDYQNMPADLVSPEMPRSVQLEIRAAGPRLNRVQPSDLAVVLNLAGVRAPGEHTFTIERQEIELPAGVRLVRTIPNQVRLRFERQVTATVPVQARFASNPPEGYQVTATEVRPPRVQVSGPESRVRALAPAETDPLDISRNYGQLQFQVPAFIRDSQVHFVSSPVVQVIVRVAKSPPGGAVSGGQTTVRN